MQRPGGSIRTIRHGGRPEAGRRGVLGALAASGAAAALAGCSGLQLVDAVTSTDGYAVARDIAYGPLPRQRMDVYVPAGKPPERPVPVVVFLYGGSWRQGSKEEYRFVGAYLARAGYVAVLPDYRLFPEVRFPVFVEDCAVATTAARRLVPGFGGDPRRVFVMGHSAGAHMAALLGLEPGYLAAVGDDARALSGVIGIAGPYDADFGTIRWLADVFPDARSRSEARVVDKARSFAPPMFLANGISDTLVPPRNAVALADRLRALGNRVDLRLYDGVSHGSILLAFAPTLAGGATLGWDIAGFMSEV